jgi:DNA-binding response OmpR family regulator
MQKPTIFIIDDSPMMTQFLSIFFEKKYHVIAYHNPLEAIQDIKNGASPDAVVTDFDMPELSGLEFIKKTRQAACEAPIIVVSAMRESKYRLNCLEAGACDFMAKPFHPAELDIRINKQLAKEEPSALSMKPSFIGKMARVAAIF